MFSNLNSFRANILRILSDALSENTAALDKLNNNRLKGDDDCGICEEIMLLRGRSEGILKVADLLQKNGIL